MDLMDDRQPTKFHFDATINGMDQMESPPMIMDSPRDEESYIKAQVNDIAAETVKTIEMVKKNTRAIRDKSEEPQTWDNVSSYMRTIKTPGK